MPLIPETLIDEIQTRADIVELIGRFVPLKQVGRHFKANCPFHKEKTPSFMINADKQVFHCFGCGVGGNIFSFLMQHDRLTFPEAVRQLADQVGVRIPTQAMGEGDAVRQRLAHLMENACRYFERTLHDPRLGHVGRAYLEQRGVSETTQRAFRLGLAPTGWNRLLTAAGAMDVSPEQLAAAGLVIKGASGWYDRFRHRLMFPIVDVRGRVIGFGGRSLDEQEPKYLNSPETVLYTKGCHLFGLASAKEAMIRAKTAVIVEGYFDCVVLADAGIAQVVSPLGTALTTEQVRLLKRYTDHVILAFDPDAAGEQATLRGIDLLVEAGLRVRVAQLPQGVDPDEHVRALGREQFEQLLERSASLFDVLIQAALQRFPIGDVERHVRAAQFVLPTIAHVPDAMLRSEYVRLLAQRLHLDEAAVVKELAKAQARQSTSLHQAGEFVEERGPSSGGAVQPPRAAASAPSATQGPERLITALILDDPIRWKQLVAEGIGINHFSDATLRRILEVIAELDATGQAATPAHVVSRVLEDGYGALIGELVQLAQSIASKDEACEDGLRRLRAHAHHRELEALREQIRIAHEAGHETEVQELLTVYQQQFRSARNFAPRNFLERRNQTRPLEWNVPEHA